MNQKLSDQWLAETRTACAKAAVAWLKGSLNTQRAIRSLSLAEMESLCEAVTSAWIVRASHRLAEPEITDDEREYLRFLLM